MHLLPSYVWPRLRSPLLFALHLLIPHPSLVTLVIEIRLDYAPASRLGLGKQGRGFLRELQLLGVGAGLPESHQLLRCGGDAAILVDEFLDG